MKNYLLFEFNETYPNGGIGDWMQHYPTVADAKTAAPGDTYTTQMVVEMAPQNSRLVPVAIATRHSDGDWRDGDHYDTFASARRQG